jgi:type VI secretion system protein ImpJ
MAARAVHWHEGMFLRPHHFQMAQRNWAAMAARGDKWDAHYNWGLRSIDLDLDALANYRCVVRSLQARLRDGTQVLIPEDAVLTPVELKNAFERTGSVTVFVGVPSLHLGRANVQSGEGVDGARFLVDTQELEDENTGINPQPIQVRLLNVKLLLSTQDHAGYEVLPICRIEKSAVAEATPQLDEAFFPSLLACEAWRPLQAGILHNIYDRIGKKIELLAGQVTSRGITFDSHSQGDAHILAQLRQLNEAYAVLSTLGSAQGVHPFWLYLELCRLVGQMAIFGESRRVPDLPHYDHDDLGGCFYRLKQLIDGLLNVFVEPDYKERPFTGAGMRMQVALEPTWLESVWDLYIGVRSELDSEDCVKLLTRPGQLDMKIGSSERVDNIFRLGHAGLRFAYAPNPPRVLPSVPGQIYLQINRDSPGGEWANVQRSLTLAIRLNENLIAGNIQGQKVLTIRTGSQTTTMQFTLYVVAAGM